MNARDQHVLVVTAVEHHDFSLLRHFGVHPPQIVVRQFEFRGGLEWRDADALRVDRIENRLDRSILAGSVHALKHQQQLRLLLGSEPILQPFQLFAELCGQRITSHLVSG